MLTAQMQPPVEVVAEIQVLVETVQAVLQETAALAANTALAEQHNSMLEVAVAAHTQVVIVVVVVV
jgi:hypothetical protein